MADTSTVLQGQYLPEYQETYLKDLLASTSALGAEGGPYIPAYEAYIAGLSPAQQKAIQTGLSGVGSYLPMMQAGEATLGQGIGGYQQGMQYALSGVPLFQQAAAQASGVLGSATPYQREAASGVRSALGGASPYQQQAAQALQAGQGMVAGSTGGYDPRSVSSFMDPYTDEVIRRAESDIARQGTQQAQDIRARAVGSGAFGGSREAIAQRELGRNVADQQARTASQLRSQGYQQAQNQAQTAFESQQRRQQQAGQLFGQLGQGIGGLGTQYGQLGLQGAGQLGALGTQYGQLGLQGAGQLSGIGGQYGALGQGLGQLSGGLGKLGLSQAALGESMQGAQQRDINALMGLGGMEQQYNQRLLDAQRRTLMEREMAPYQQLGFMSDIFRGVPSTTSTLTSSTAPSPSMISQIGGLGMGLAGLGQSGLFDSLFGRGN
jgi:hypothetical protein